MYICGIFGYSIYLYLFSHVHLWDLRICNMFVFVFTCAYMFTCGVSHGTCKSTVQASFLCVDISCCVPSVSLKAR